MDQVKIGRFIAACRKAGGWTQSEIAAQLGVSDKAVSKWETGKSLPDYPLLLPLCSLLKITLNELLLAERISDAEYKEKSDQILYDMIGQWLGQDQALPQRKRNHSCPVLNVSHVRKIYTEEEVKTLAVDDVSFEVEKGSFIGIMGASGCGKTTLLKLIATMDRVSEGTIEIAGQPLQALTEPQLAQFRGTHLGFIFQEYNLLDTLTLRENIALALAIRSTAPAHSQKFIEELAEKFEIAEVLDQFPYAVSGGQRQRCACARAIASHPSLILADEPTGALDSRSARQLLEMLVMLRRDYGATLLMATHDVMSASYCDRILFMRDGRIQTELERSSLSKQAYFTEILKTLTDVTERAVHGA
ncbi:ATP-binding cassette domain-containing protein [Holdemania massiliensis]|uniref:ATP-binding cassette domain-containing protein n=1 Tax=Holdemania massiliensis TaxID=1468449 RepID=A0A6N7S9I7_9FIRM|nr:ATP-binding cassette domain-containing protein [Holdemania massiliensis]MSA90312.1 ATP-binding cassette domain-containing protein [Holdemania massiliensis]MSB79118.1 ATP-binding cassette domain-containing protein [Holdemania massiliensis]MSC34042.1 ATP-binding cassette domain-containing protein [Holdemania massiliensis]MSC40432.1 ATP-binding cassette domain-containing protein [Holdemania massiliensis]